MPASLPSHPDARPAQSPPTPHAGPAQARWRYQYGADTLLSSWNDRYPHHDTLSRYWPGGQTGIARSGAPVLLCRLGAVDFGRLRDMGMLHAAVRHNVYLIEECLAERPLGAIVMIFDMGSHDADADAAPSDHALDRAGITSFLGLLAPILAKHYPLVLEALFVVRSPADDGWLRRLIASLEPAVDPAHASVVPSGAQNTLSALSASVPLEAIPTFLGGTREVRGGCARKMGGEGVEPQGCEAARARSDPVAPRAGVRRHRAAARGWQAGRPVARRRALPPPPTMETQCSGAIPTAAARRGP